MLAKCLWKMYSCDEKVRGNSKPVDLDDVLDSLLDAIDTLPQRKDSRSDPIFEPHYKLLSIIHKLVYRDILTVRLTFSFLVFVCLINTTVACRGKQNSSRNSLGSKSQSSRRQGWVEVLHTRSASKFETRRQVKLASPNGDEGKCQDINNSHYRTCTDITSLRISTTMTKKMRLPP